MPATDVTDRPRMIEDFREAMHDCERLYRTAAEEHAQTNPQKLGVPARQFVSEMLDLQRALIVKLFLDTARADLQLTHGERELAAEMAEHVLDRRLTGSSLARMLEENAAHTARLDWKQLVAPFIELPTFARRVGEFQTVVMRIANLVSKIDGVATPETVAHIKGVQYQLWQHLGRGGQRSEVGSQRSEVGSQRSEVGSQRSEVGGQEDASAAPVDPAAEAAKLEAALAEMDALVGLDVIKREVRALINYLRLQRERQRLGLPATSLSLHMVFGGNPGTGKTTVARIVGRVFGALGILKRGHLIETDRSGLVAEYVGQTGPKTNKKVDEALDGILFIDEAYSLVAENGDDPFGAEAVQTLLKRSEDNRDRLVVILAGYTGPMDRLLHSNPGLSSRFSRRLEFPDYTADELCSILESLCGQNHYSLDEAARCKVAAGFERAVAARDEHFGNGRLVRNVFEDAIRRMANRIAEIVPLTHEILTTLEAEDFAISLPRQRRPCAGF
ncbi:MAG: AAA family ATPase [Planctomycetes bacterium]|nr:AAA family ATPase [Planctomycetota bacterium]